MQDIFIAKSVEEAKSAAASAFGVAESKISFKVLEEPKKGIFGITRGEAKVEAVYEPTKAELAAEYIGSLLREMGVEAELNVTEQEDGALIDIIGGDTGSIIGRRGDTIDSIQYLASMACNKGDKEYYRITVDSCGYREKRKQTLEELAAKIANSVKKTGRTSALEPMNPYERRIIHSTIAGIDGVVSRSVGDEPYRKVVISSTEKPRYDKRRGGRDNRNGGRGGRKGGNRPPRDIDLKTSFEKDYKRPKPEDDINAGLYGKIEF